MALLGEHSALSLDGKNWREVLVQYAQRQHEVRVEVGAGASRARDTREAQRLVVDVERSEVERSADVGVAVE